MNETVRQYLASLGKIGGKTTGKAKVRGNSAYYKRLSAKAAAARKRNALLRRKGGQP
jgi:hypothetical protein